MNTPFAENQSTKLQGNYWLSVFWMLIFIILWTAVTGLKHHFDSRHYCTVDGNYYTELSHDVLEGRQMTISGIQNKAGKSFSPYPPGYPVLLAAVEWIHPDPIVPNHIWLHSFLIMMLGLIWVRFLPGWPLILFFFTDTVLELGTYNWSEFSFICSLIITSILLAKIKMNKTNTQFFLLLVALVASSLIRYAAIFQILVITLLVVAYFQKDRTHSLGLFRILLAYGFFLIVFSGWEWWMAGQVTGGDRYPNTDSANELFLSLATETGNQLMIFKDFAGSSSFSFRAGLVALVILLYLLYRHFQKQPSLEQTEPGLRSSTLISSVAFHLLLMGLGYLVFMIPTRWYFYFAESFDLRLLGPGFGLIWLSFFTFLSSKTKKTPRLALWLFVCFSLFFALPKQPMFDAYQEKFWMRTGPVFPSR